jgi:hypothetical protein
MLEKNESGDKGPKTLSVLKDMHPFYMYQGIPISIMSTESNLNLM